MSATTTSTDPVRTTNGDPRVFSPDLFGQSIVDAGDLGEADWRVACEMARQSGTTEIKALLDLGLMSEDRLADQLAAWSQMKRWDVEHEAALLAESIPLDFMRTNAVIVLDSEDDPRIIVSDPSDRFSWNSLRARIGDATVEIGTHKEIQSFLEQNQREQAPSSAQENTETAGIDITRELSALRDLASEAPVVRYLNQTLERAIDLGASDVHLERYDRRASLRFRVDGALIDQSPPADSMVEPLLCRIKIMAGIDIAERRRAQDGRLQMRFRGRAVDMRLSLVPTIYGQDAVLRIQDRQKLATLDLAGLGFTPLQIDALMRAASKSHGIVLITGPTGSGKTTTLYAVLKRLISSERKIVTVEDPVEYAMDGVNQIQINPQVDLSFSNTLRHVLRHDPDTILIGEIRDQETARIAFQASLTGHLVLSTLHTNDVASTFVRIVDMGVEPYLVCAAVEAVSAQRLVRRLCDRCHNDADARQGCASCGGLGYRGRVALMECSRLSSELKRLIQDGADEQRLTEVLRKDGCVSLVDSGQDLVRRGITDREELTRVLGLDTGGDET